MLKLKVPLNKSQPTMLHVHKYQRFKAMSKCVLHFSFCVSVVLCDLSVCRVLCCDWANVGRHM